MISFVYLDQMTTLRTDETNAIPPADVHRPVPLSGRNISRLLRLERRKACGLVPVRSVLHDCALLMRERRGRERP